MCGKVPESLANVLARCSSLTQTKYMERHNAALKVLFFAMLRDLKLACSSMVLTGGTQRCTSQKTLKHTGMISLRRAHFRSNQQGVHVIWRPQVDEGVG